MSNIKYASYTQISPERDVASTNFSRGQINFKMNMHSMTRWNPYKSYLRMRINLSKADGNPLDEFDGISPNMFMGDCFWQQMNIQCNGVQISEISDYVAQVSSLRQRYSIPESRRKNFLSGTNFAQSNFIDRQNEIIGSGHRQINSSINQFTDLANNAGVNILITEEIRVVALNIIEYRLAGDAGLGVVDLTQSVLKIGDKIRLNQAANLNFIANITAITANTITVDRNMVAFGSEDILANKILFESVDSSHSIISRRVKQFELIFKPCMGLFSVDDYLPGNWKLQLTPHTNLKYQRYAIESLLDKIPETDYKLEVIDLQFYAWIGRESKPSHGLKEYDFTEIRCQAQTVTSNTLQNKAFVVNTNSHTFTLAFQKPNSGDDTRFSKSKFRMLNDYEKRITRYQMRINGETLPTPLPDIDTDSANNTDFATQQYYEQLQYHRSIYLDDPEGLNEWFNRGPYYSYKLPRELNAKSNRLYVSTEFQIGNPENFLLLVFDHYYSGFKLHLKNGLVQKVEKNIMIN